jgi:hypothetical protein
LALLLRRPFVDYPGGKEGLVSDHVGTTLSGREFHQLGCFVAWRLPLCKRIFVEHGPTTEGSPVNGLPTELLADIFDVGTHLEDDPDSDSDHRLPFSVLVSHVCRLWRSVAVGSPSFWTTISFSKRPPFERPKVWIDRSKPLPIDVFINHQETMDEVFDIIVPHVTRWRELKVWVNKDTAMENVLTRLAQCASAPLLEILSVHHWNPEGYRPESPLVPFHGNAPRLSYVALQDVVIDWSSPLFHDLVKFELSNEARNMYMRPSWADFSRILRESPRLTNLTLAYSGPAGPPTDWQDELIELPSLENFSLMYYDSRWVSSLFRRLSMPNLKKLSLDFHGVEGDYSQFIHQLATPPRSVLSGLQHLRIKDLSCYDDSSAINAMYEQLTNLKSINVNCSVIHKAFFTTLMEPFSGTLYCPNLTAIITSRIPGHQMRSFVEARAAAGIPIKRIVMTKADHVNEEDERWLRENVQTFQRYYISDEIDKHVSDFPY